MYITAMLYPIQGPQLFRDLIYTTNGDLFSLAFSELEEGKERRANLDKQRGFIPDHRHGREPPHMFSDIPIPLPHPTVLRALCSFAVPVEIWHNTSFWVLLPYLLKDFIFLSLDQRQLFSI